VGRAVCAGCHSRKASRRRTLDGSRAVPSVQARFSLSPNTYKSGIYSYEIVTEALSHYRVTDGKETLSEPIFYAFGMPDRTTIFFATTADFRSGSYYKAIDGLDWTIGMP